MTNKTIDSYEEFILNKSQAGSESGFDPVWMPDFLFDFQSDRVEWALRKGRRDIEENAEMDFGDGEEHDAP